MKGMVRTRSKRGRMMDKLKYSPEPWIAKTNPSKQSYSIFDANDDYIAEIIKRDVPLFLAAPEMYEAILKMIRYYYNHGPFIPACYTIVELRAIIAKIHKEE